MTRVTPRTCLWPLTISLLATFALSTGLTFYQNDAPHCFAGVCGEHLFPLQARLHVLVWYLWIAFSVTFLGIRAFHPSLAKWLRRPLRAEKLPVLGKQLCVGGLLLLLWTLTLYVVIVAFWWSALREYFQERGHQAGIQTGGNRLAAVALTGHICDVTTGMIILPVSRHSALASFFKLSVSTTLAAHMIAAYTLFFFILLHGFLYVAWLPVFDSLSEVARRALPVLNPTYLYNETWPGLTSSLGIWRASLVFTGLAATVCFAFIFITTLPFIRNRHFNVFYFFHLLGVVGIVIVCLHASTMLYCVAPGLAMWLLDWGMRFYELRQKLAGSITSLGRGWYTITVPLPRHRLDGCACKSPLAHFYVYHAASSIRELHPFTTITHLATQNALTAPDDEEFPIQFLFRKSDKTVSSTKDLATFQDDDRPLIPRLFRKVKRPKMQWTNQVASLVDNHPSPNGTENTASAEALEKGIAIKQRLPSVDVGLRLEGPYFTPADPAHFNTTVCFVAGTGVSGAIAIAAAFSLQERISVLGSSGSQTPTMSRPPSRALKAALAIPDTLVPTLWKRCIVVWSVREDDVVDLPWLISEVEGSGLDLQIHLTGAGRPRLNLAMKLAEIRKNAGLSESTWVYLSGPGPFIAAGEKACKEAPLGVDGRPVEYYGARWGV